MREEALSGTELAERLDISLALLSHHWKILADAGLIQCTQQGQIKFGTLQRQQISALMSTCMCPEQYAEATNDDAPKKKPRLPKRSTRSR